MHEAHDEPEAVAQTGQLSRAQPEAAVQVEVYEVVSEPRSQVAVCAHQPQPVRAVHAEHDAAAAQSTQADVSYDQSAASQVGAA